MDNVKIASTAASVVDSDSVLARASKRVYAKPVLHVLEMTATAAKANMGGDAGNGNNSHS